MSDEDRLKQVAEWFNEYCEASPFPSFDEVEPKFSQRGDLHGMILLDKLFPGNGDMVSSAEHDRIFFQPDYDEIATLTKEQVKELVSCGIYYDSGLDCLYSFV